MTTKAKVREVPAEKITETIGRLCQEANYYLPEDVYDALRNARAKEQGPRAQRILDIVLKNADIAKNEKMALCQDTGTTVVMVEIGQDVHVEGNIEEAINKGISQGYTGGFLRASIVKHPFSQRLNTKDNTPGVIHYELVPGDKLKLTVMPKGGGCENMSRLAILLPGAGKKGIIDHVIRTIEESGGNPCPPLIVGIGIGGTAEHCMFLAKKSLIRKVGDHNADPEVAQFETELLERVNALGIGPQAWGGMTTALAVNIETYPTHITALPVGVNLQCHSARFKVAEI